MESLNKIIQRQDAHFKLTKSTSNETSINLSKEISDYISKESGNVNFILHREDFLKAIGVICNILPLYNRDNLVESSINVFESLYNEVYSYFEHNETIRYTVQHLKRDDNRYYLNNLSVQGFNLRHFLVERHSTLIFGEKTETSIELRLKTTIQYVDDDIRLDNDFIETVRNKFINYLKLTNYHMGNHDYYISKFETELNKILSRNLGREVSIFSFINIDNLKNTLDEIEKIDEDLASIKGEYKGTKYPSYTVLKQYYSFLEILKDCKTILKSPKKTNVPNNKIKCEQIIFYGAPGTGKSFTINRDTKDEDVIRTTFHPDTDYSSFVGAYKPTMRDAIKNQSILDYEALVDKLKEYIVQQQQNITKACTMFGFDYHDSIVEMQKVSSHTIMQLVADGYKSGTTYDTQIRAGMSVYENSGINEVNSEQIVYRFVSQSFLQAYVKAWQKYAEAGKEKPQKQYLVIEEINRGNCAQIFGDLFQLLDRNDSGFSDYPITADADMKKQLMKEFKKFTIENKDDINILYDGRDVVSEVLNGDILLLPNNLYIWATMNTSDQSLFPIDSAFKRRWNWRYIPISNRNQGYKIEVNGNYYDWWEFLKAINGKIWDAYHSEDKKLGYFFAKADGDNIIDSELFVGKVIFYLWNDVFKDFIDENEDLFNDEDGTKLTFDKFYETLPSGETKVVEKKAEQFLKNLKLEPMASDFISNDEVINTLSIIKVNGKEVKKINAIPYTTIEEYVRLNSDMSAQDVIDIWAPFKRCSMRSWIVANKQEIESLEPRYANYSYEIKCSDGSSLWVNKDGWMHNLTNKNLRDTIGEFINAVNGANFGITITEESNS